MKSQHPSPIYHNNLFSDALDLDVEEGLELDDELPLVVGDFLAVVFLQTVDTGTGDLAVQGVLLLEVTAVGGLVTAHFNLDSDGGLALFADRDLLVVSLDRGTVFKC